MAELNKTASEVMRKLRVKTATDVTGFGFLGHLSEIVIQSKVTAEVYVGQVPVFEGVLDLVKQEMISGAIERNKEYASQYVTVESGVSSSREAVLYDAQTSGGLLIAVKEEKSKELVSLLKKRGVTSAAVVGKITGRSDGKIILKSQPGRSKKKFVIVGQDKENQRINTR